MTKKKRFGVSQALSRGLSETINVVENNAGIFRNVVIPISRIEFDPDNPRKLAISIKDIQQGIDKSDPRYEQKFREFEKIKELAATIESSGIINPIVVYKRGEVYRVVAGERRCLASMLVHKNEIEARVFNEKPRGFELKLIQWIENTVREDLTLEERIGNIREIIREYQHVNVTSEITATLLKNITGLSLPQATYYVSVMQAPDDVQKAIQEGKLRSLDKAALVANITSETERYHALQACLAGCSLKELRKIIASEKKAFRKKETIKPEAKRGRVLSRVNMGFTLKTEVVQIMVESILAKHEFQKYNNVFSHINWKHYDHASQAFKKLIEILEHEIGS